MQDRQTERDTFPRADRIRVSVTSCFVPERSNPSQDYYLYAYTVVITNEGSLPCQLLSRYWIITDSTGHEEHVQGPGVVGEQPHLGPGQTFIYTSACPLHTPVGSMRGAYQMVNSAGRHFEAQIPAFALARRQDIN